MRILFMGLVAMLFLSCSSPTEPESPVVLACGVVTCVEEIPLNEVTIRFICSDRGELIACEHPNADGAYRIETTEDYTGLTIEGWAYYGDYEAYQYWVSYSSTIRWDPVLK